MGKLVFATDDKRGLTPEKPREKMGMYGPEALQLWELIAILLRTGVHSKRQSEDVMRLARRLLAECGFKGLFSQNSVAAVQEHFGVYKIHAESIVAVAEICRRLHGKYDSFDAAEPTQVFERFRFLQSAKQEQCYVLHLNKDQQCVYQEMVAIGSSDHVHVHPNDVLRTPLWLGTREIIIVHNHPGVAQASKEDISWTLALAKGAQELHNICVVDHMIIGKNGYFSFQEKGLL